MADFKTKASSNSVSYIPFRKEHLPSTAIEGHHINHIKKTKKFLHPLCSSQIMVICIYGKTFEVWEQG